ncbi:putative dienelactone hydrolase family protein [Venustampulla echinocandica]|uniref:Putative dienelactone hydrolase family protein n=1 Tax=Venustampulla echinocandica TaxID=2656787 RepID=A0A370U0E1_9HELO|nr:putative dienelactone hydrolase family protein [Venustampulla echinocandica]RDL41239.1 putative dienelactone hydrolase family protein [Venustampulla echinocandica]
MLIQETHTDVPTKADGKVGSMRIFLFHPTIPGYPKARFPGVVLFSEIYQGGFNLHSDATTRNETGEDPLFVARGPLTGPVARFARQIAGQGYIVAAPSSYHEFTGPEPLAYDVPGTDSGNLWKISKTLAAYDEDSSLAIDTLLALPTCNGRIGATGMCLGGHLAYRCALDPRISAAVTYFATDIHSATLALGKKDNSLARAGEIKGELALIFGTKDNHVPAEGRDVIRKTLRDSGVVFSWYEFAGAQHAFIRDEESKGRYDPAITKICFEVLLELFGRNLKIDLGAHDGLEQKIENIC